MPSHAYTFLCAQTDTGTDKAKTSMSAEDETTNGTTPRLYVGNIPWSATEQELRDLFADTPGVRRVEIPTGRQGRSRGYGLVEFDTAEEAAAAVSRVDGT